MATSTLGTVNRYLKFLNNPLLYLYMMKGRVKLPIPNLGRHYHPEKAFDYGLFSSLATTIASCEYII